MGTPAPKPRKSTAARRPRSVPPLHSQPVPPSAADAAVPPESHGPQAPDPPIPSPHARPARLLGLDALRGFDMLWIVGGRELLLAWSAATGWPLLATLARQCEHAEWHGFTFWDLVFPLFLFIAGVSLPFSFAVRLARGHSRRALARHALRRAALLVALGVLYNLVRDKAFLASGHPADLRYASVLGRIGLGAAGAALIVLRWGVRGQILWVAVLLLGYHALLLWVPVPGHGAGDLTPGHTLADWVDQQFLPGRLHRGDRDPEGLLSTLPAVATALLGALTGAWLQRRPRNTATSLSLLAAAGLALLLGGLWSRVLPLNKNLWTSSFVLWTGGWSLALLALFHQLVDVLGWRRLAFPLTVVGCNAITIYLLERFLPFDDWLLSLSAAGVAGVPWVELLGVGLLLRWLVLYALYRRKLFVRI